MNKREENLFSKLFYNSLSFSERSWSKTQKFFPSVFEINKQEIIMINSKKNLCDKSSGRVFTVPVS